MRKVLIFCSLIVGTSCFSQIGSLSPSVLGTTGGTTTNGTLVLSSNTGECMVSTASAPSIVLTQGFEQPSSDLLSTANNCGILVYHGLTPNADGHNDTWIIDFVDLHPENTMEIYNRWGALVWKGTNYDNGTGSNGTQNGTVWAGLDNANQQVPAGTYFFIFSTPDCSSNGWVEVSN